MAKDDKGKGGKGKGAKGKDEKEPKEKAKGKKKGTEAEPYSSIATHPRARASVQRVRARTGLIAFAVAAGLSFQAHVPIDLVGLRALGAGLGGYMLAWWVSIKVWRHLMIAEQKAAVEEIKRRRAERTELNQQAAASR